MSRSTQFFILVLTLAGTIMNQAEIQAGEPGAPLVIAIHGGAGTIEKGEFSEQKELDLRRTLEQAVLAGHAVLKEGGSSLDAVTRAVTLLEDSPFFNAAKGAVFNAEGKNELDASIMEGASLEAGAVAAVKNIRNPILLARRVMTDSAHVMLMGDGAERFARDHGLQFEDDGYFFTEYRWQQLQKARAAGGDTTWLSETPDQWFSTVGAVALDAQGNLAAATSTGGMTNKRWGRVGDSPIIGAGTYADNRSCAVSATGHGEYFIRATVARDICARVQYTGADLAAAADQVVNRQLVEMGGSGGIIAVDPAGNIALTFNTPGMYRASVDSLGNVYVAIYGDE
ncbi:MAG: isoaspartyl peptidase/L-asparaginase [Xanthomonadales bacterium]|nr:isoaspartyl peptidase/L-asparaginase [Gammaproteobacteria bacterium]NND57120.1 isoaspartyl peptidase/L-asparaginase [Xanthomonadales bacterium]NNK52770.1 isoaspartyl peptidase/L-asparaginase [Xanthomonadales bacterium]